MLASIVIRTLNEARYLEELLQQIVAQRTDGLDHEVVLIDSGSTDDTVEIARRYNARITTITKAEFSFGRSLNRGSEFARGDILVYVSGHCVPASEHWLQELCQPLMDGTVSYTYGRQIGNENSNYSERRIFAKYFPSTSQVPQDGFFCNNANSAVTRAAWEEALFDEDLTGLEDMEMAKRLVARGHKVGYVAEAPVYHLHHESWPQVRRRFEREALALQQIMPEIQVNRLDMLRYITSSVTMDYKSLIGTGALWRNLLPVLRYRVAQYTGSYAGNHTHRKLSARRRELYFYPAVEKSEKTHAARSFNPHCGAATYESKQPAREG